MTSILAPAHTTNAQLKHGAQTTCSKTSKAIMKRVSEWLIDFCGPGWLRGSVLLLALSVLIFVPTGARANCTITAGTAPAAVNFAPPSSITVSYTAAVGTVLYQSGSVAPTNPNSMTCSNNSIFGVNNNVGAQPGTTATIYPTSIAGVGYSIGHNTATNLLLPYPCCTIANNTYTNSTPSFLTLVKTGPIVSGSTVPAGTLAYWLYASGLRVEAFNLSNSVTIIDPACSVNTTPINVTLPTVSTGALASVGATAGTTPFAIALTCSSGATLDIELDYAGTASNITGVLTKTSGTSAGVGLRLLDQNYNPVVFGATTVVGSTPTGALSIPYYAQYYRTAAVTVGSINASATFTLSYQ
jgi:type 1 fimbria pilin